LHRRNPVRLCGTLPAIVIQSMFRVIAIDALPWSP
jgi:hypothetical protein